MASTNENSDELPPLEDCSSYIKKLQNHRRQLAEVTPGEIPTDLNIRDITSLVDISQEGSIFFKMDPSTKDTIKPSASPITSKPFKRGFLNSKPSPTARLSHVPFLKASKKAEAERVPDFLRLDLKDDPEEQLRKEMKDLLKPTQELVSEVLSNKEIQAGLEDPEIMIAVQDIASNPTAMQKYKHHPKIVNFYNCMGKLMDERIEKQEAARKKRDTSKRTEF